MAPDDAIAGGGKPGGSDHRWAATRLIAFDSSLLTAAEEERVRAHLEACEECRDFLRLLHDREPAEAGGPHLDPGLMSAWKRRSAALRGRERDLVSRHLARCETCREELVLLGSEPALAAEAVPRAGAAGPAPRLRIPRRARWWSNVWTVRGGLVAAAAALFLVARTGMMERSLEPHPQSPTARTDEGGAAGSPPRVASPPGTPSPHADPSAPARAPLGPASIQLVHDAPLAVDLPHPEPTRGGGLPDTSVRALPRVDVTGSGFAIRVPDMLILELEPTSRLAVELRSPTGTSLARSTWSGEALFRDRVLAFGPFDPALAPGDYRLELRIDAAGRRAGVTPVLLRVR